MDLDGNKTLEKIIDGEWTALSFSLLVANSDPLRAMAAEEVKLSLGEALFNVNIEMVDIEEYNERIQSGDYDAFLGAIYCADPYDVTSILCSDGSINYEIFSCPEMDFAVSNLMSATSVDKASVAFSKLQSLYAIYQPIAGMVFRTTYVVTSPYIEGEIKPYPYSPYANIASWSLVGLDEEKGN